MANVRLALEQRLEATYTADVVPKGEAIALSEAGGKIRIVSRGDSNLLTILHNLRDILYQLLRQDPTINRQLAGDEAGAIESMIEDALKANCLGHVLSSDMTVATDGVYQDAAIAAWEGIADAISLSDKARAYGRLALGPQELSWDFVKTRYKRGEHVEGRTNRGILMGLPISWAILNVLHRWAAEQAIANTELKTRKLGYLFRKRPYRIFGDDAIAIWPKRTCDEYERLLRSIGFSISLTKHFLSPPLSRGPAYGMFCEKIYRFTTQPGMWKYYVSHPNVERMLVYPLKGLTHAGGVVAEKGKERDRNLPAWATIGPAINSLLDYNPVSWPGLRWACRYLHPGLAKWLHKHGIPPYLPRSLGGGGLLPRKGLQTPIKEVASKSHRLALACLYTSESPHSDWEIYSRAWASSKTGRHQALAVEFTEGVFEKGAYMTFWKGQLLPNGYEDVDLTREEVEKKLNHWWRKGFLFLMGPDLVRGWKQSPFKTGNRIRKGTRSVPMTQHLSPLSRPSLQDILDRKAWHGEQTRCARRVTNVAGQPLDTERRDRDEVEREVLDEFFDGSYPERWSEQIQLEELVNRRSEPDLSSYSDSLIKGPRTGSALSRQREIALTLGWRAFLFKE
jgi:hypothetical protein